MGRNARYLEDQDESRGSSRWTRWFGLVPLLPAITLVIVVAVVATALSTRVVALNFTGTAPSIGPVNGSELGGQPLASPNTALTVAYTSRQVNPRQFTGTVRISNGTQQPLTTWRMTLRFADASVVRVRRAKAVKLGPVLVVRGAGPLASGALAVLTFTARGTAADPVSCSINGRACNISG